MHFIVLIAFITESLGTQHARLTHAYTPRVRDVHLVKLEEEGVEQGLVSKRRGWRHFTFRRLFVFIVMVCIVAAFVYCCFARDSPYIWSQLVEVVQGFMERL